MEKFKQGDVVQLKSGGPKMTVKSLNDEGVCTVNGLLAASCKLDGSRLIL